MKKPLNLDDISFMAVLICNSRKDCMERIKDMLPYLESEMLLTANDCLEKLNTMTDEEYSKIDWDSALTPIPFFDD